ncbi:protein of unknown function [Candidatus Nitrosocosmicus franklandus]|uniref:Uncharacterized protein n=1 Tax=Candidatus Nitrosocosmicus franklandianus TaxID=1798806 RepID=A0A484IGF4_9ARCH|nr:protein of unknown function [Candidatus Nitrosocosmicus franklandus]
MNIFEDSNKVFGKSTDSPILNSTNDGSVNLDVMINSDKNII